MTEEFNLIITGVGGQGVILISELLGKATVRDGLNIRGSEALGMSARGGAVSCTIRIGDSVISPLITAGKCDVLLGMEPAEAMRNITYLSRSSRVLVNTRSVIPFTVTVGQSSYPELETIMAKLRKASDNVIQLDAVQIAEEAGSAQSANIVMLGALFGGTEIPIKTDTIKEQIQSRFSPRVGPVNLKAFEMGYQQAGLISNKL